MSVDADIGDDVDLLGKVASDLQDDIEIGTDSISGILNYVTDYTGYSGDPALQSGNFLAIHAEVPGVDDVTITVKMTTEAELDEDGLAVLRIADKDSQTVKVVASKEGYKTVTRTFDLTGLVCEEDDANDQGS